MFKPKLDVKIELPGVTVATVHEIRTVFIYDTDSGMPDDRYDALEAHLKRQGYFLQVIVGPHITVAIPGGLRANSETE